MITALDTKVLVDILRPNQRFVRPAVEAVEAAAVSGSLVICEIVMLKSAFTFPTGAPAMRFCRRRR
jgi:hypothetical protein